MSDRTSAMRRFAQAASSRSRWPAGGGMLIGFPLRVAAPADDSRRRSRNAFVRIDTHGRVTLILPYVEMGQGSYTSQAQILAEELEVASRLP